MYFVSSGPEITKSARDLIKNNSLFQLVQKLQNQLENQQDVLKQYEPRLKKKEKETRELSKVTKIKTIKL